MEGRESLDERSEPKARAIADFIGGNPRLAQLLGEVLDTDATPAPNQRNQGKVRSGLRDRCD